MSGSSAEPEPRPHAHPPCTYQLLLTVGRSTAVRVGALGWYSLPPGGYIYTGSARRTPLSRVRRHLQAHKPMRWHIDHLLAQPGVQVVDVWTSNQPECVLNQETGGAIPVPGFGASDCRAGCGSHLRRIDPVEFLRKPPWR